MQSEAATAAGYLDEKTRRRLGRLLRDLYEDVVLLPMPGHLIALQHRLPLELGRRR